MPPKIKILMFIQETKNLCVEKAPRHVFTFQIFDITIFEMSFWLSKNGLCL
jgi:hypothetical protein